jgi:hypothetical protein
MQVIRTRSFSTILRRWFVGFVVFIAMLSAVAIAFANEPPKALNDYLLQKTRMVHDGNCNVKQMNLLEVPCLIFYEEDKSIVWLVLFDKDKNGNWKSTHILADKDGQLVSVWCRQDVCA